MAGIPLFTPDYLSSPTMFGAISPTTARIMSETGKQIADTIEKNNAKLEAHAKAPQIASLMGEGLKRLSDGDMSGFQILSQAQSIGASNPFLMKMTQDAISTGGSMARNYMDNALADTRIKAQNDRQDSLLKRQEDAQQAILDRQREENYNREVVQTKNEYQKTLQKHAEDQENENRTAAAEGRQARQLPKPPPPALPPPPAPMARAYGGTGEATPPATRRLPFGHQPTGASGAGGLFSLEGDLPQADAPDGAPAAPAAQPAATGASPITSNQPVPDQGVDPANEVAKSVPEVQKQAAEMYRKGDKEGADKLLIENKLPPITGEVKRHQGPIVDVVPTSTAKVGDMLISFPTPKETKARTDNIPQPGGGTATFKSGEDPASKDWKELQDSAAELNGSHGGFAKWAAKAVKRGDSIDFGTPDKEGNYHPKTVGGEQYGHKEVRKDDEKETTVFVPDAVPKTAKEAWSTGQKAMSRLSGKGLQIEFPETKYTEEQLTKQRGSVKAALMEDLAKAKDPEEKGAILKEANKLASERGFPAFSPDELAPKTTAKETKSDLSLPEVNDILTKAGSKPLSQTEMAEAKRGPLQIAGEIFESFKQAVTMDRNEQKQLFQQKIDTYNKVIQDPNSSSRDKIRAAELVKKYMDLMK